MVTRVFRSCIALIMLSIALPVVVKAGDFSKDAVAIGDAYKNAPIRIHAPNKKASVTAKFVPRGSERELLLVVQHHGRTETLRAGLGVGSELLWSPDSNAFSLTTSDEGRNGVFKTFLYAITRDGVTRIDVNQKIRDVFGHPVKCSWPEPPNIAALAWVRSSSRVLIAAEIVHHSVCDSYGTFVVYEVELATQRVVKTYDQLVAKRLFHAYLGGELRQANDECIINPKQCEVPANHQ